MHKLIIKILFGKEGETMMAMLWAQQIMLGKAAFEDVPRLLKDKVKALLVDSGCADLAEA